MNISAIIPARISSKRLPKKNIKFLNGRPLLFWSIDVALEAGCYNSVCVSTESSEVADLVKKYYPKSEVTVLMRPEELATDETDLREVCRHFLVSFQEVEMLHLMMPTYPFRNVKTITEKILPAIYTGQVTRVLSVRPESFSTFDYWIKSGREYVRMFTHQPLWCEASNSAYSVLRRDYFFKEPHLWDYHRCERALKITTDFYESIDIDTMEDWEKAEKVASGLKYTTKKIIRKSINKNDFIVPEGTDVPSFKDYLMDNGCDLSKPVLILKSPPPYFAFLRWHAVGSYKDYARQITWEITQNLPSAGHSQDYPEHFYHSPAYRVLRKDKDQSGIMEETVPESQVIFYSNLKKWDGFIEPFFWNGEKTKEKGKA